MYIYNTFYIVTRGRTREYKVVVSSVLRPNAARVQKTGLVVVVVGGGGIIASDRRRRRSSSRTRGVNIACMHTFINVY